MQSDEYKLGWNLRKFYKNDEMVHLKLSMIGEKRTSPLKKRLFVLVHCINNKINFSLGHVSKTRQIDDRFSNEV